MPSKAQTILELFVGAIAKAHNVRNFEAMSVETLDQLCINTVRGGVFTVSAGHNVAVACREGVLGDSLEVPTTPRFTNGLAGIDIKAS
jgi:hypothetical protein